MSVRAGRADARRAAAAIASIVLIASSPLAAQDTVRLYAAGSLRGVMTDIAGAWAAAGGAKVDATWGASGLLRDRLAGGEKADVFASANLEHPRSLEASGRAGRVSLFARNALCALSAASARVTEETLLDRLLDPAVKVGTSTPKADPSGDYAWALFARAEALRPGARAALESKALKLTGGPDSPPPPPDRSVYGVLVAGGQADVFLTYCTNALVARREQPALVVTSIPAALAVGADYGIVALAGASPAAIRFVAYVLSADGRAILARHGFATP